MGSPAISSVVVTSLTRVSNRSELKWYPRIVHLKANQWEYMHLEEQVGHSELLRNGGNVCSKNSIPHPMGER